MFYYQDEMYREQEEKIKEMQVKYLGMSKKKPKTRAAQKNKSYTAYVSDSAIGKSNDVDMANINRRMLRI